MHNCEEHQNLKKIELKNFHNKCEKINLKKTSLIKKYYYFFKDVYYLSLQFKRYIF